MDITIPLVLVEGFLSATSANFWGKFEQFLHPGGKPDHRIVLFTSVGPVSSLHDRACELYYELKGGRVDYGEKHSRDFGHEQYGREHRAGLYPVWSAERPLHFLGHSLGGPTIIKLMSLLRDGFFGAEAHPDMVLSVTTVSAPFRGTQLVYTLGEKVDAAPAVRTFSIGTLLSCSVHWLAYLAPLLPRLPLDLHADARRLSCRQSSFSAFLRQLWHSDWAESCDAAPYDCTFVAADVREARGEGTPHSRTWYRSYTCTFQSSKFSMFSFSANMVASFDFAPLRPWPSWLPTTDDSEQAVRDGLLGEEYRANDGVVPVFSQWHPFPCSAGLCTHDDYEKVPAPGLWYVRNVPGTAHHLALVHVWLGTQQQRDFWVQVGWWLDDVEAAWGRLSYP